MAKKSSTKSKVESRKSKVESRKSRVESLESKIGVVALYFRGLLFHRSDAGYLLMEYIDYMELTEKIEHPNKSVKNRSECE